MGGLWQCFTHIIVISYWQLNDIDTSMTLSILKSFCQRCEIVFMLRNWDGIRYQLSAAHQLPYTSTDDRVLVGWFNSKVHCWYTYMHACMHTDIHTYIYIYIYIYICVCWYPIGGLMISPWAPWCRQRKQMLKTHMLERWQSHPLRLS